MQPAVQQIFVEWELPPWLTLGIALTAAIYLRGWLKLRRTRPRQFTLGRLACFLSGMAVLWLAIASPMDGFADASLSAHMVEHLLLMSAVPPLLLCGLPVVPLLRGLPRILLRSVVAPLLRLPWLRHLLHRLTAPLVAWLLMNLSFLAWHVPAAYDFALEHEAWHDVEHICFLSTSLLFWWVILRPWPAPKVARSWGIIIFLVTADVVNTILSAVLAFCDRPLYLYYLHVPSPFGLAPLEEQTLGAVIMWVLGSFAFLVPAMVLTLRMVGSSAHLDAE